MSNSLDIRLKKADRVYHAGEVVKGIVVLESKGGFSHNGITMVMEGVVTLQLSAKSVGLFEAFYNSLKPVPLAGLTIEVAKAGKVPDGITELPFEFPLSPLPGQTLYDSYHGVYVNISYVLRCSVPVRSIMSKNLERTLEFIVEVPSNAKDDAEKVSFKLTPESLENAKRVATGKIPRFVVEGHLNTANCNLSRPFGGSLTVTECEAPIKSIELQLVRVETCGCADGFAKEATEIQNIQIADGDIPRNLPLQLHMVFPRLFTCQTIHTRTFKIEFEVNLVVIFQDGNLITENFPIKLIRPPTTSLAGGLGS
jgi:hypothetical protein